MIISFQKCWKNTKDHQEKKLLILVFINLTLIIKFLHILISRLVFDIKYYLYFGIDYNWNETDKCKYVYIYSGHLNLLITLLKLIFIFEILIMNLKNGLIILISIPNEKNQIISV